jgi:hypothetical protein
MRTTDDDFSSFLLQFSSPLLHTLEVVFSFSSFSVRFRSGIYVSFVFKPTNHVSQNSYLDKKTTSGCFSNIVNEEYSSS